MLEVRVKNYRDFNKALGLKCDKVSFGSEGCHWLLPDKKELVDMILLSKEHNKIFKLVLPKATESGINKILELVTYINELKIPIEVTVNDLGVLSKIYQLKYIDIYLGHILNWSMQACPWYENLIRDESDRIKDMSLEVNNDNTYKLDLLKQMGVKGIDVDSWTEGFESLKRIMEQGYIISVFFKRTSISFSRTCPTAKFLNIPVSECKKNCMEMQPLNISLIKLWQGDEYGQHYEEPKPGITDYFDMHIQGNWIYKNNDTEDRFLTSFDNVIVFIEEYEELENRTLKVQ